MKIHFDENHLLSIENPNIPQLKSYSYSAWGYVFSSFDKGILCYHKKQWKITNLKNLWDDMQVAYLPQSNIDPYQLHPEWIEKGLAFFSWFDEEREEQYHFLPFFGKGIQQIQSLFEQLQLPCRIEKKSWVTVIHGIEKTFSIPENTEDQLNLLFLFMKLYGKLETKQSEVYAAKIHLPLLGAWGMLEEVIDQIIQQLSEQGLFVSKSIVSNNGKNTLQLQTNDYQILALFIKREQKIYPEAQLSLPDKSQKTQEALIHFLTHEQQIPEEGKNETLQLLSNTPIKFLKI